MVCCKSTRRDAEISHLSCLSFRSLKNIRSVLPVMLQVQCSEKRCVRLCLRHVNNSKAAGKLASKTVEEAKAEWSQDQAD